MKYQNLSLSYEHQIKYLPYSALVEMGEVKTFNLSPGKSLRKFVSHRLSKFPLLCHFYTLFTATIP